MKHHAKKNCEAFQTMCIVGSFVRVDMEFRPNLKLHVD